MDNQPILPNPPTLKKQSGYKWWMIIGFVMIVIILTLVYFFRSSLFRQTAKINQTATVPLPSQNPNSFFDSQSATIFNGQISKVNGSKLTVINSRGQSRDFEASNQILIYNDEGATKLVNGLLVASSSADLKQIIIGKAAQVTLEFAKGNYQVVSVVYMPVNSSPR